MSDLSWIRSVVRQCDEARVACFVKQLGSNPVELEALAGFGMLSEDLKNALWGLHDRKGGDPSEWPEDLRVQEFPEVRHG